MFGASSNCLVISQIAALRTETPQVSEAGHPVFSLTAARSLDQSLKLFVPGDILPPAQQLQAERP
jgi:hypothetical protein